MWELIVSVLKSYQVIAARINGKNLNLQERKLLRQILIQRLFEAFFDGFLITRINKREMAKLTWKLRT